MNRMKKMLCTLTSLVMLVSQTVSAESLYLVMSGTTDDINAKGATILVLDEDTDIANATAEDILYINQSNIEADGSYKMILPFFANEAYIVRSNMNGFEFTEMQKDKVLYVSASGSDSAAGTENAPLKTMTKAYESINELKEIVIVGTVEYKDAPSNYEGVLTVSGAAGATLTLPSEVSLKGDLTLSGVSLSGASTIYANGKNLKINEDVTSTSRLTVYGATKGTAYNGDTSITLLGGLYQRVYGGGSAAMTGNTYVTLGGNANAGDGNDDKASNISPCYVYGGTSAGNVTGETNVTLSGNAVAKMIYGAGAAGGATKTHIHITGGKVMNVFGGSNGATIDGCETNITITGGLAEAIFGGSENHPMTNSHTHVNLLGGDVSRRVYSGSYNGTSGLGMATTHAVAGTHTITFGKNAKVNTKTGLASDNQSDIGVHGGSRLKSVNSNEKVTVIYLEDCYSDMNGEMGAKDFQATILGLKNNVTYTVKATAGGKITVPNIAGTLSLAPDVNHVAQIGNSVYGAENVSISSGTTSVTFAKNFAIDSVDATVTEDGLTADVALSATNLTNKTQPQILVAIYDAETKVMIDCKQVDTTTSMTSQSFDFTCDLEAGKTYFVKAMLWSAEYAPLTTSYQIQIQK